MRVSLRWVIASVLVAGSTIAQAKPGDLMFEFQKPNHVAGDVFGRQMAAVGDKVLISSPCDDTSGPDAGAVFMYDGSGRLVQTFYNPTPYSGPAGGEYFGGALSSIGNSILIGDKWDSSVVEHLGAVYLFDPNTAQLQRTILNPTGIGSPGPYVEGIHEFGCSVAPVGSNSILVGAKWATDTSSNDSNAYGAAYLMDAATGQLLRTFTSPTPQPESRFGCTGVQVGDKIAISQTRWGPSPQTVGPEYGAVQIYDVNTGQYLRTISNPAPRPNAQFGETLAVLGDKLVVGGAVESMCSTPTRARRSCP